MSYIPGKSVGGRFSPGFLMALRALGAKLISDEEEGQPGGGRLSPDFLLILARGRAGSIKHMGGRAGLGLSSYKPQSLRRFGGSIASRARHQHQPDALGSFMASMGPLV